MPPPQLDPSSPLSHLQFFACFERFSYLQRYDHADRCSVLERLYDLEIRRPENARLFDERVAYFREMLADVGGAGLTPADAPALVEELRRSYCLEQLAVLVGLGTPGFTDEVVAIERRDLLDEVLARDGSALLVTPHMGPHLALQLALHTLGFRFVTGGGIGDELVAGTPRICELQGIAQLPFLVFDDDFGARLRAYVSEGYSLSIYPEYSRSKRRGGLMTDFLGVRVHCPTGTARLGLELGRRLVGVSFRRTRPFHHAIRFGPVWTVSGDHEIAPTTLAIFRWVEEQVLADPGRFEGWNWLENMVGNAMRIERAHAEGSR